MYFYDASCLTPEAVSCYCGSTLTASAVAAGKAQLPSQQNGIAKYLASGKASQASLASQPVTQQQQQGQQCNEDNAAAGADHTADSTVMAVGTYSKNNTGIAAQLSGFAQRVSNAVQTALHANGCTVDQNDSGMEFAYAADPATTVAPMTKRRRLSAAVRKHLCRGQQELEDEHGHVSTAPSASCRAESKQQCVNSSVGVGESHDCSPQQQRPHAAPGRVVLGTFVHKRAGEHSNCRSNLDGHRASSTGANTAAAVAADMDAAPCEAPCHSSNLHLGASLLKQPAFATGNKTLRDPFLQVDLGSRGESQPGSQLVSMSLETCTHKQSGQQHLRVQLALRTSVPSDAADCQLDVDDGAAELSMGGSIQVGIGQVQHTGTQADRYMGTSLHSRRHQQQHCDLNDSDLLCNGQGLQGSQGLGATDSWLHGTGASLGAGLSQLGAGCARVTKGSAVGALAALSAGSFGVGPAAWAAGTQCKSLSGSAAMGATRFMCSHKNTDTDSPFDVEEGEEVMSPVKPHSLALGVGPQWRPKHRSRTLLKATALDDVGGFGTGGSTSSQEGRTCRAGVDGSVGYGTMNNHYHSADVVSGLVNDKGHEGVLGLGCQIDEFGVSALEGSSGSECGDMAPCHAAVADVIKGGKRGLLDRFDLLACDTTSQGLVFGACQRQQHSAESLPDLSVGLNMDSQDGNQGSAGVLRQHTDMHQHAGALSMMPGSDSYAAAFKDGFVEDDASMLPDVDMQDSPGCDLHKDTCLSPAACRHTSTVANDGELFEEFRVSPLHAEHDVVLTHITAANRGRQRHLAADKDVNDCLIGRDTLGSFDGSRPDALAGCSNDQANAAAPVLLESSPVLQESDPNSTAQDDFHSIRHVNKYAKLAEFALDKVQGKSTAARPNQASTTTTSCHKYNVFVMCEDRLDSHPATAGQNVATSVSRRAPSTSTAANPALAHQHGRLLQSRGKGSKQQRRGVKQASLKDSCGVFAQFACRKQAGASGKIGSQ